MISQAKHCHVFAVFIKQNATLALQVVGITAPHILTIEYNDERSANRCIFSDVACVVRRIVFGAWQDDLGIRNDVTELRNETVLRPDFDSLQAISRRLTRSLREMRSGDF